jgi:hypothetical protein
MTSYKIIRNSSLTNKYGARDICCEQQTTIYTLEILRYEILSAYYYYNAYRNKCCKSSGAGAEPFSNYNGFGWYLCKRLIGTLVSS